uniref:transposase n=1 Tax=Chryseobacterium luteum TaxID=421531 RepID=UPI00373FD496
MEDKVLFRKIAITETINDELKSYCQVEHIRYRSVNNFMINILGGLTTYCFFAKNCHSI